jgi:endoglucanase
MDKLGKQPQAKWFGDWNRNIESDVRSYVEAAKPQNAVPVLVAYNIPQRDCGSYSAGGSTDADAYMNWMWSFTRGVGFSPAMVILEPDATSSLDCLNEEDRTKRMQLLAQAIALLKKQPNTKVYLDGGNPRWHSANEMSSRLTSANIKQADGFSLNVSNFYSTEENTKYGNDLSAKLQGSRYVIDTSRNGNGPANDQQWCNPAGRALGKLPTTATGNPLVDAYLWIKAPGESDGSCNGAPGAGQWWAEYGLGLAQRATWQ